MSSRSLMKIESLEAGYGDVQILWGVSLEVYSGEITAVIGSNGAGKSTLMRTISGLIPSSGGTITFEGKNISGLNPKAVLAEGIAHVPEGRRLFKGLSVEDNLLIGSYTRESSKSEIKRDLDFIYGIFPRLKERHQQDASTLSGGEQQMCAIGRGLMSKPKLLIIDELSLGLAPKAVDQLVEALCQLNRDGLTILLVEQDVFTALEISKRSYVIESGKVAISGLSIDLHDNPKIQEAYLGM
jgi:branched-chain amino acid transport system ATP-binding protein